MNVFYISVCIILGIFCLISGVSCLLFAIREIKERQDVSDIFIALIVGGATIVCFVCGFGFIISPFLEHGVIV